jgi:hypothetical protein
MLARAAGAGPVDAPDSRSAAILHGLAGDVADPADSKQRVWIYGGDGPANKIVLPEVMEAYRELKALGFTQQTASGRLTRVRRDIESSDPHGSELQTGRGKEGNEHRRERAALFILRS